ncbi:MAG: AraC family transcriptional regulator [Comamonadaceae bacterium]|nr:MAG: AraC family transcriptional regulator [Comamonadaceae bacterium]
MNSSVVKQFSAGVIAAAPGPGACKRASACTTAGLPRPVRTLLQAGANGRLWSSSPIEPGFSPPPGRCRPPMLSLDPLYKHCVLETRERPQTHTLVSHELSEHVLRWHDGGADTRMFKFHARRLSIYSLSYGAEVSIFPERYDGFSLVHFAHRGPIEIEADGMRRGLMPGRAVVSTPRQDVNLRWSRECEQIILRMPHDFLKETAERIERPDLFHALAANPGLALSSWANGQWQNQLELFIQLDAHAREQAAFVPWLEHVERGMATFLLLQAGEQGAPGTPATADPAFTRREWRTRQRVDRLHEHAKAHLSEPMSLSELARAAFMSERQLHALCLEQFGASPLIWLRRLRLDAVRQRLRAVPDSDVAATAMLYGFPHAGRFAQYYRERFNELPSHTVRTARSG